MVSLSPLLLVISFDAFMFQYFNVSSLHLPNFDYLQRRGVLAPMEPLFTSKTLPNHWAYATGLFEESSNIVDNSMYDPDLGLFNWELNASEFTSWFTHRYSGEPIWVSNEKSTIDIRRSGVYMWPAGLIGTVNKTFAAKYIEPYNFSTIFDFKRSVDTVMDWMRTKDVNFAMLYYPEPDRTAHKHGPFATEVLRKVEKVDDELGYLIRKLKTESMDLWSRLNILIVSDHGMTKIKHVIDISSLLNYSDILLPNVIVQVKPKPGKTDIVISKLKELGHCTVYKKADIPEHFHYRNSERILPVIAIPEEGYIFTDKPDDFDLKGQHGYDPVLPSMHGIFLASGPKFKSGIIRKKSVKPIDAHALMAHILEVSTPKDNGSLDRIEDILNLDFYDRYARLNTSNSFFSNKLHLSSFSVSLVVVVVVCAVCISTTFLVRIFINRKYTIRTFRDTREGLVPLTSYSNGSTPYGSQPNGSIKHVDEYQPVSQVSDE